MPVGESNWPGDFPLRPKQNRSLPLALNFWHFGEKIGIQEPTNLDRNAFPKE